MVSKRQKLKLCKAFMHRISFFTLFYYINNVGGKSKAYACYQKSFFSKLHLGFNFFRWNSPLR